MPSIYFFSEGVEIRLLARKTKAWIKKVIATETRNLGELNYIFCSDKFLAQLNHRYLKHDSLTDIITFDSSENTSIQGDIYISVDRVRENAAKFKTTFDNELRRVMIHGVLHLLGYSDKNHQDRKMMRNKEDAYLSLWEIP